MIDIRATKSVRPYYPRAIKVRTDSASLSPEGHATDNASLR